MHLRGEVPVRRLHLLQGRGQVLQDGGRGWREVRLRHRLCLQSGVQVRRLHLLQGGGRLLQSGCGGSLQVPVREGMCLRSRLQVPWLHLLQDRGIVSSSDIPEDATDSARRPADERWCRFAAA
jgi:hypothetical protein